MSQFFLNKTKNGRGSKNKKTLNCSHWTNPCFVAHSTIYPPVDNFEKIRPSDPYFLPVFLRSGVSKTRVVPDSWFWSLKTQNFRPPPAAPRLFLPLEIIICRSQNSKIFCPPDVLIPFSEQFRFIPFSFPESIPTAGRRTPTQRKSATGLTLKVGRPDRLPR